MSEFPVQRFTGQLAVTSPSVRFATDAGEQYDAAAIKSISNMLVEIDQIQGKAELSTMRRRYQEDSFSFFNEYSKTGDPEQRQAIIQAWQDRANSIQSKRGWVNQEFKSYLDNVQPYWQQNFMSQEVKHNLAAVESETTINKSRALELGDSAMYKENADLQWNAGLYPSRKAYEEDLAGFEQNSVAVRIKGELIAAIGDTYDKQKGYDVLDQYYNKGLIDPDQNKALGDWIDSYVAGRTKRATTDKYNATIQTYQDFSKKLITGGVNQDDVASAGFDDKTEADWQSIVKGSFKPAPTSATHEGISTIIADVMDFSTLKISKKEAYDSILKARFVDKSITDDDYAWALNRIENPYPKHVVENAQDVMKAAEGFYRERGWFFGADWIDAQEQQLLTAKKKAFLSWLDDEIEGGKVPGEKDMYAKMMAMNVLVGEPVSAPGGMYGHSVAPPDPNDPLFITTDEQYDKIPEDTAFYDGLTGRWLYKPKKGQSPQERPTGSDALRFIPAAGLTL